MHKVGKLIILVILICLRFSSVSQTSTFSFNINGAVPAGLATSLASAGAKWSQYLQITVPIKVNVFTVNSTLFPFSGIAFANGRQNFTNAPHANFMYVTALANQIAGTETNSGEYDMDIYFNLATPFYFGSGKPSSSQVDFMTTAMHEIGHGLGFYTAGYVNASNIGSFGNVPASAISPATTSFPWKGQDGAPTIFDKYLVKQSQNSLISCAAPNSVALGDSIKYGPIYFSGPLYANLANANKPVAVESGNGTFSFGQDLFHLDDTFQNTIMSYSWGAGDTVRSPSAVELSILKEIGWAFAKPVAVNNEKFEQFPIDLYPSPANESLTIKGEGIENVKIYNTLGALLKTIYGDPQSAFFILNLSDFQHGLYFAEIRTVYHNSTIVRRFIKE